jgi:hypothetical protein
MRTPFCVSRMQRSAALIAYTCAVLLTTGCEIKVEPVDSGWADGGWPDAGDVGDAGEDAGRCREGTFDNDDRPHTQCVAYRECQPGEYVVREPGEHADRVCTACMSGTFSTEKNATECQVWTECPTGMYVENTPSDTEDRVCVMCADGTTTSGSNEAGCLSPNVCSAGSVANEQPDAANACEPCIAGSYCAGGRAEPQSCEDGTWDHDMNPATPCIRRTQCLAGQYVAAEGDAGNDRRCAACSGGSASVEANADSCAPFRNCMPGKYISFSGSAAADRVCSNCPSGSFSTGMNATICQPLWSCEPGSFVQSTGSVVSDRTCQGCSTGTFSATSNSEACTAWRDCEAGTHVSSEPGMTRDRGCEPCGNGTTTHGKNWGVCVSQDQCPAGTVQTSAQPAKCAPCVAGTYCAGTDLPSVACDGDSWDHDHDPVTACVARRNCVSGEYVSDNGSPVTDRTCSPCGEGKFSRGSNERECKAWTVCEPGKYMSKSGGTSTDRQCTTCAEGMFSSTANASDCTRHSDCLPGEMVSSDASDVQDRSCTGCNSGRFSIRANAAQCEAWTDCQPGSYVTNTPSSASDRVCATCRQGEISAQANQASCLPSGACQPGTHETQPGSASSDPVCEACEAGNFCGGGRAQPSPCADGTWDHDSNPATNCVGKTLCTTGELVLTAGSTVSDRTCQGCAAGSFSSTTNADACTTWTQCDPGSYVTASGDNKSDRVCTGCANGSFSGSSNASACSPHTECIAGQHVTTTASYTRDRVCSACDSGTWSGLPNADSCASWSQCSEGQYASLAGGAASDRVCLPCAPESYSNAPNVSACTSWTVCRPGSRVDMYGSSTSDRVCTSCDSGTFTIADNTLSCTAYSDCEAGSYVSLMGSSSNDRGCSACFEGYSTDRNTAACTPWTRCDPGFYASTPGSTTTNLACGPCGQGSFTSSQNIALSCEPWHDCQPGTTLAGPGSSTNDVRCDACPENTFSDTTNAGSCNRFRSCTAGWYESTPPSAARDRSCSECALGSFSMVENASACRPWTPCGEYEQVSVAGSSTEDQDCELRPAPQPTFLWLDASDASTLETNGDDVTLWRDKSGNNRHASVPNNSFAPKLSTGTGPAGKPEIRFQGGSVRLQTVPVESVPEMTVFVVFSWSNPGMWGSILNQGHDSLYSIRKADGSLSWQIGNRNDAPLLPAYADAFQLLTTMQENGSATMYYDRSRIESTPQANISAGMAPITIGNAMSDAQSMGGSIVEIRMFDRALPEPQRRAVELDLKARYALGFDSCRAIAARNAAAVSGRYGIDPDGAGPATPQTVVCDMPQGWIVIAEEDFQSGADGWSPDTTSRCGNSNDVLGGSEIFGQGKGSEKSFDLRGLLHTEARVVLEYIKIDTWDGEEAFVELDGAKKYSQRFNTNEGMNNLCGLTTVEYVAPVDVTINHSSNQLTVRVASTLTSDSPNPEDSYESFAIDNFSVRIR